MIMVLNYVVVSKKTFIMWEDVTDAAVIAVTMPLRSLRIP